MTCRAIGPRLAAMDQYDDDEAGRERVLSNSQVLGFIAGFWTRRPWLLTATLALTLVAIGCELMLPPASKRLIDAIAAGPANVARGWEAWALFVGVYLAFAVIRNVAFRF